MQWEDVEEQQLIGADKLDSQHNKTLELVIFRTLRRLCAPVHVALVIMIWMNHLSSLMLTEHDVCKA